MKKTQRFLDGNQRRLNVASIRWTWQYYICNQWIGNDNNAESHNRDLHRLRMFLSRARLPEA